MRVIAVESFTDAAGGFHPYGHEFNMDDSPERAGLLAKGTIRMDDRLAMTKTVASEAERTAAATPMIAGVQAVSTQEITAAAPGG